MTTFNLPANIIDASVLDTDAKTFVKQKPMDVLTQGEDHKVDHYNASVKLNSGTFSPFIVSTDGLLAPQAQKVLNAIAQRLSTRISGFHQKCSTDYGCAYNLPSYVQPAMSCEQHPVTFATLVASQSSLTMNWPILQHLM